MLDAPLSPNRRWLRPQFSLASIFILTTLTALAAWYWYQRPFVVENKLAEPDPFAATQPQWTHRELESVRRVWGGKTVRHGPWRVYDNAGKLHRSGEYRNGQPDGEFLVFDTATGNKAELITYASGLRDGPMRQWNEKGDLIHEINYRAGVMHGPIDARSRNGQPAMRGQYENGKPAGTWVWFPKGSTIVGSWRDATPDGHWEWRDKDDRVYASIEFDRGQLINRSDADDETFSANFVASAFAKPGVLLWLYGFIELDLKGIELNEAMQFASERARVPIIVNTRALEQESISPDTPITFQCKETPFVMAMNALLRPLKLGLDYRYGLIYIDTLQSIANWTDTTGVLALAPQAGSKVAQIIDQETTIDFVEQPLKDVVLYISELHQLPIRLDLTPKPGHRARISDDIPITKRLLGVSLRQALGIILSEIDCKVSLENDTLLIEPQ